MNITHVNLQQSKGNQNGNNDKSSPCDQKATNAKSHFSGEAKNCLFFLVLHA